MLPFLGVGPVNAPDPDSDDPDPVRPGLAADLPLGPDGACNARRLQLNEVYRLHNGSVWRWNGREFMQARLPARN